MYIYIYIYIHTYAYIYIYIYTHVYEGRRLLRLRLLVLGRRLLPLRLRDMLVSVKNTPLEKNTLRSMSLKNTKSREACTKGLFHRHRHGIAIQVRGCSLVPSSRFTTQNAATTSTCVPSFACLRSRTTSEVVVHRALGLYLYIYIYVYVCVCIHIYIYMYMSLSLYIYIYV